MCFTAIEKIGKWEIGLSHICHVANERKATVCQISFREMSQKFRVIGHLSVALLTRRSQNQLPAVVKQSAATWCGEIIARNPASSNVTQFQL